MKEPLPTVKQCLDYMNQSCHYDFVGQFKGSGRRYVLRDRTGQRPNHIAEMLWSLNELRHAFKYGW